MSASTYEILCCAQDRAYRETSLKVNMRCRYMFGKSGVHDCILNDGAWMPERTAQLMKQGISKGSHGDHNSSDVFPSCSFGCARRRYETAVQSATAVL
jgi:hypothetical protein